MPVRTQRSTAARPQMTRRRYRSREESERGRREMERRGWVLVSRTPVERRRRSGLALGVVGYWLLPKRREYEIVYVQKKAAVRSAGAGPGG